MKIKNKSKKIKNGLFTFFCVFVSFMLISSIGNLFSSYQAPLYISQDFTMVRNEPGRYTFSGKIVNESSITIKVNYINVVAFEPGKLQDPFGFPCSFVNFEVGAMENVTLTKEVHIEDYKNTEEKLFSNGVGSADADTIFCVLDNGEEYYLRSYEDIEDDKKRGIMGIIIALIGGIILFLVHMVKYRRDSKQQVKVD